MTRLHLLGSDGRPDLLVTGGGSSGGAGGSPPPPPPPPPACLLGRGELGADPAQLSLVWGAGEGAGAAWC